MADYVPALRNTTIGQLKKMLRQAGKEAFEDEVIETEMLELELEQLPGVSREQFEEDWIEEWLLALKEKTLGRDAVRPIELQ